MHFRDGRFQWPGAFREGGRCADEPGRPPETPRSWKRGPAPLRVIASGKVCPRCGAVTHLSCLTCPRCGHAYRTLFPNRLAPPPDAAVSPSRLPSPEVSASRAKNVFRLACVLMTALATGLIFYLVNYY